MRLSFIIPVLNEAESILDHLESLAPFAGRGVEIVVVDGGSTDGTPTLAAAAGYRVIPALRGRASQMNAGVRVSHGDVLLFLHADTRLPGDADRLIAEAMRKGAVGGRFDVRLEGRSPLLAVVARLMNERSRLTGIATGDQAIFVRREAFVAVHGYADLPLMEDIVLSRDLKRLGRPACLRARVVTSGRRWERHGILRTILAMWRLRLAFFFGADPRRLAITYGYQPRDA